MAVGLVDAGRVHVCAMLVAFAVLVAFVVDDLIRRDGLICLASPAHLSLLSDRA
jgi:hypothetical protein